MRTDQAQWLVSCPACTIASGLSQSLQGTGIAPVALLTQIKTTHAERRHCLGTRTAGPSATGVVMKKQLVSVVEDDRFFRESMGRLMRSLGYTVETFPSAAEFLASPRVAETACLITDVHMPGMTGIELHRQLVAAGYAIPTILVTAYPNDIDQGRALNDGVVCYLRKPVDEQRLTRCLRAALTSSEPIEGDS